MGEKRRVVIRASAKQVEDWDRMAQRLGLARGSLVSVAAAIGMQILKRQIAPEEAIDTKVMADVLEELHRRGVEIDFSDVKGK